MKSPKRLRRKTAKRIKGFPLIVKCMMCRDTVGKFAYEYNPIQYITDYIPPTLHTCKKCVYRELFGSKNFRKKMKEGVLDGKI